MSCDQVLCYLPSWRKQVINKIGVVTRSSGLRFQDFQSDETFLDFVKEDEKSAMRSILLIEFDTQLVDQIISTNKKCIVVTFLSSQGLRAIAGTMAPKANVHCFVASENRDIDARDLLVMLKKFHRGEITGLKKYLGYGADIQNEIIHTQDRKNLAIGKIHDFVVNLGGNLETEKFSEYARIISELVDELILNAVFNANPRLVGVDRQLPFNLAEKENIQLNWGFDGEFFGIAVSDQFGNLERETILSYLGDRKPVSRRISESQSGGLGIKMIFDRLHRFVINVKKNEITEAICLLRFESRLRDFERHHRSFYYFTEPEDLAS